MALLVMTLTFIISPPNNFPLVVLLLALFVSGVSVVLMFPAICAYAGLWHGGLFHIQHFTLCTLLERSNIIPRRLPQFLAYAANLGFLVKVGGSYQFFHQTLRDYFAEVDIQALLKKSAKANTPQEKEISCHHQ